jgi:hypothetical protein
MHLLFTHILLILDVPSWALFWWSTITPQEFRLLSLIVSKFGTKQFITQDIQEHVREKSEWLGNIFKSLKQLQRLSFLFQESTQTKHKGSSYTINEDHLMSLVQIYKMLLVCICPPQLKDHVINHVRELIDI